MDEKGLFSVKHIQAQIEARVKASQSKEDGSVSSDMEENAEDNQQ